jgi:hypothetical protein
MAKQNSTVSKTEAVRQAIAAGSELPSDGVAWIKEHYGFVMTKAHFSAAKTKLRAEGGSAAVKKAPPTESAIIRHIEKIEADTGYKLTVEDMRIVKALVERVGAEQTREMIELFE